MSIREVSGDPFPPPKVLGIVGKALGLLVQGDRFPARLVTPAIGAMNFFCAKAWGGRGRSRVHRSVIVDGSVEPIHNELSCLSLSLSPWGDKPGVHFPQLNVEIEMFVSGVPSQVVQKLCIRELHSPLTR